MYEKGSQSTNWDTKAPNGSKGNLLTQGTVQLAPLATEEMNNPSDVDKSSEEAETTVFSSPQISLDSANSTEQYFSAVITKSGHPVEHPTSDEDIKQGTPGADIANPGTSTARNGVSRSAPKTVQEENDQNIVTELEFLCDCCRIDFRSTSHLKRHDDACHKNIRPYTCMRCWAGFKRKDHAKQHARRKRPCKAPTNLVFYQPNPTRG